MDYNEIMEKLENCLGLEKPVFRAVNPKKPAKIATEGYDGVETELANKPEIKAPESAPEAEVGAEVDPGDEEEKTPKGVFVDAVKAYLDHLYEDGYKPDEANEVVIADVNEILGITKETVEKDTTEPPKNPAAEEGLSNLEKIKNLLNSADDMIDEKPIEESFNKGELSAKEFLDNKYEEMKAKMLSRYESLCCNTKKVSNESIDEEPKLNEKALNRVSMEFGYNINQLKEIIKSALKEGVI